jgi:DNA repair exonuclease SbcCD ATPase subunit
LEDQLSQLRADATEVSGDLEVDTMEWHRERQDAETHLRAYRDRARELKVRLDALQQSGDDSPCPTCGRLLNEHYQKVLEVLQEEWDSVVQDGKWWRRRSEQLLLMPEALREVEIRSIRMHAQVEALAEQVEVARSAVRELEDLKVLRAALVRRRSPGAAST